MAPEAVPVSLGENQENTGRKVRDFGRLCADCIPSFSCCPTQGSYTSKMVGIDLRRSIDQWFSTLPEFEYPGVCDPQDHTTFEGYGLVFTQQTPRCMGSPTQAFTGAPSHRDSEDNNRDPFLICRDSSQKARPMEFPPWKPPKSLCASKVV